MIAYFSALQGHNFGLKGRGAKFTPFLTPPFPSFPSRPSLTGVWGQSPQWMGARGYYPRKKLKFNMRFGAF